MRLRVFEPGRCRAGGNGSDRPFFSLCSRGHGGRSASAAARRRAAALLPLRGPPVSGFLATRSALPKSIFFRLL